MSTSPDRGMLEPPKAPLEFLSQEISRHFQISHIEGDRFRYAFFCPALADKAPIKSETEALDGAFDAVRVAIKPFAYVATLQVAGAYAVITVSRIIDPKFSSPWVNWAFFVGTLITVQWAGAFLWSTHIAPPGPTGQEPSLSLLDPESLVGGFLYFMLPLMSILGLHEMGHFFTARHYNVRASLPFFIPSVPPLGTWGAFISMRDPLPSRKIIFDIGISGPIVGFVAAIVVTVAGVLFTQAAPVPPRPEVGGGVNFGTPLMFDFILSFFNVPPSYIHPTLFAGWAGFLVTAFNLIPAAQLDGGHVFFSMLRNGPRREENAVLASFVGVLVIASIGVAMNNLGWAILFAIVLMTIRHPPPLNLVSALGGKRVAAGLLAFAVFAVSFVPAPIEYVEPNYSFEVEASVLAYEIPASGLVNASFNLTNTGNTYNEVEARVTGSVGPFYAVFNDTLNSTIILLNKLEFQNRSVNVTLLSTSSSDNGTGVVQLSLVAKSDPSKAYTLVFHMRAVTPHPAVNLTTRDVPSPVLPGDDANFTIVVTNTGDTSLDLILTAPTVTGSWAWGFTSIGDLDANVTLLPGRAANIPFIVHIASSAPHGEQQHFVIQVNDTSWPGVIAQTNVTLATPTS